MDSLSESVARILEIEARQDEALRLLEELERRIEQVLAEHLPLVSPVTIPLAAAGVPAPASLPAVEAA